jgi:hypothetical protein
MPAAHTQGSTASSLRVLFASTGVQIFHLRRDVALTPPRRSPYRMTYQAGPTLPSPIPMPPHNTALTGPAQLCLPVYHHPLGGSLPGG